MKNKTGSLIIIQCTGVFIANIFTVELHHKLHNILRIFKLFSVQDCSVEKSKTVTDLFMHVLSFVIAWFCAAYLG